MRQRGERSLSTQELFCSEGNTLTGETSSHDRFEPLRRLNDAMPKDSAALFFFSQGDNSPTVASPNVVLEAYLSRRAP